VNRPGKIIIAEYVKNFKNEYFTITAIIIIAVLLILCVNPVKAIFRRGCVLRPYIIAINSSASVRSNLHILDIHSIMFVSMLSDVAAMRVGSTESQ
jgi:hypothetical protein